MEKEFNVNDSMTVVQYKLSHDTDRGNKNYLDIFLGFCSGQFQRYVGW